LPGILSILAPASNVTAPPTPLTQKIPAPAATGFTQVDSLRSAFRGRLNRLLSFDPTALGNASSTLNFSAGARPYGATPYARAQTLITGRSSITAGTPARVSRAGFCLILGQVLSAPFSSAKVNGPKPGVAYFGGAQSNRFAVKI